MLSSTLLKLNLNSQLAATQSLTAADFDGSLWLAAISQTLDKVVLCQHKTDNSDDERLASTTVARQTSGQQAKLLVLGQVVKSVALEQLNVKVDSNDQMVTRKLFLLVGCSDSLVVFDLPDCIQVASFNTQGPINSFLTTCDNESANELDGSDGQQTCLLVCASSKKIYSFETTQAVRSTQLNSSTLTLLSSNFNVGVSGTNFELSGELTTKHTVQPNCLQTLVLVINSVSQNSNSATTTYQQQTTRAKTLNFLAVGCLEGCIKVHRIEHFELQVQQNCSLIIEETAPIACLCSFGMNRASANGIARKSKKNSSMASSLPEFQELTMIDEHSDEDNDEDSANEHSQKQQTIGQINFLAFVLADSSIGVYRLVAFDNNQTTALNIIDRPSMTIASMPKPTIVAERIWRLKCKDQPKALIMFDANGDGIDELLVAFDNCKLEVRHSLTGELLGSKKCFSRLNVKLAGAISTKISNDFEVGQQRLVVASIDGSVIAYNRPYSKNMKQMLSNVFLQQTDKNFESLLSLHQEESITTDQKQLNSTITLQHPSWLWGQFQCKQSANLVASLAQLESENLRAQKSLDKFKLRKERQIHENQIYQHYRQQSSTCEISHCWTLDESSTKPCLQLLLGISVKREFERVKLVKLQDPSCKLLKDGSLIIDVSHMSDDSIICDDHSEEGQKSIDSKLQDVIEGDEAQSKQYQTRNRRLRASDESVIKITVNFRQMFEQDGRFLLKINCFVVDLSDNYIEGLNFEASNAFAIVSQPIVVPHFSSLWPFELTMSEDEFAKKTTMSFEFEFDDIDQGNDDEESPIQKRTVNEWLIENFLCLNQFSHFSSQTDENKNEHLNNETNLAISSNLSRFLNAYKDEGEEDDDADDGGDDDEDDNDDDDEDSEDDATWRRFDESQLYKYNFALLDNSSLLKIQNQSKNFIEESKFDLILADLKLFYQKDKIDIKEKSFYRRPEVSLSFLDEFSQNNDDLQAIKHVIKNKKLEESNANLSSCLLRIKLTDGKKLLLESCVNSNVMPILQKLLLDCDLNNSLTLTGQARQKQNIDLLPVYHDIESKLRTNSKEKSRELLPISSVRCLNELISSDLSEANMKLEHIEESERRIASELFEGNATCRSFLEQMSLAWQIDEFETARQILAELSTTLSGIQNAARALSLNADEKVVAESSRQSLASQLDLLTNLTATTRHKQIDDDFNAI